MPTGLVLMKWDERLGVSILAKYPESIDVTNKTLMQIYSTHEYSGESGLISLNVGSMNLVSYYTGPDIGVYMILALTLDEDPEVFEDGLSDATRLVIQNLENDAYRLLIPSIFQRLSVYPKLTEELKTAMLYTDKARRMVIKRLQEEGSLLKSEVTVWLKDQYRDGFADVEGLMQSLIKDSIIKTRSVKGSPSEMLYLINDIFITRVPPTELIRESVSRGLPQKLAEDYKSEVTSFFREYENTEEDNLKLLNTLLDPATYETLKLLRQAIVTRDDLEKLQKKGVNDIDAVLKNLWDVQMIVVLRDEAGNEYYALQSNVQIEKIFPEYALNLIREQYSLKAISLQAALEYIDTLKDEYRARFTKSRAST
ncbi:MAG: hypothetical protein JW776_16475 [Candidatus Lokiarchaeota archaeon]|nr:hypothetical protein [Candidatus Lokiarchaeota archaeon]